MAADAVGAATWHVTYGEWFDEQQAEGHVNVFVAVVDEHGMLASGIPVRWFWQDGSDVQPTEIKRDPWLGELYSLDLDMNVPAPAYGVRIDGQPGDMITGLGLGSIEQPHYKIHAGYFFKFQKFIGLTPLPPEPEPEPDPSSCIRFGGCDHKPLGRRSA